MILDSVTAWDVPNAAAVVVDHDGSVLAATGDLTHLFQLASISKVMAGWATMIAVEEGIVTLADPVGQPGCTLRHLLAHAGGYGFDGPDPIMPPERRRTYSNTGIELAADAVAAASGMPFADYLHAAVFEPLGMHGARLGGSPAHGVHATAADLVPFLSELQSPRLLSPEGAAEVTAVQYSDLSGIVPGVGRFAPCPWGLGTEIRGDKWPHWTGSSNSPATFGHFGGSGTMLWVDPIVGCGMTALTDRPFEQWPEALPSWQTISDDVLTGVETARR